MSGESIDPFKAFSLFNSSRLPLYTSTTRSDCGLACIAMIGRFHGHDIDLIALRRRYATSSKGTSFRVLGDIASSLHLIPRAVKLNLDGLRVLKTPCILHWNRNHFVVLKKISRKHAVIHDPAGGIARLTLESVSRRFTGFAMELTPTIDFQPVTINAQRIRLRDFVRYVGGLPVFLVQLLILSLSLQVFALLSPLYIQAVVDKAVASDDISLLLLLATGFVTLEVLRAAISTFRGWISACVGASLSYQLKNNLLAHIMKLPLDFFQTRHMGDVLSRFGSLENVKAFMTSNMVSVFVDGMMTVAALTLMFTYNINLTLFVVAIMLIDLFVRMAMFRPLRNSTENQLIARANANSNFMETIRAITAIKVFGRETDRQQVWQNLSVRQFNSELSMTKWGLALGGIRQTLGGIENVVVVCIAALMVIRTEFTIGMLFAFIAYKAQFTSGLTGLFDKVMQVRMLRLHLDRIADIALADPEAAEQNIQKIDTKRVRGALALEGIDFRYGYGEPWILRNFDLQVGAGESVALVGPSGCGKTTAMKIAVGLLRPTNGTVRLDELLIDQVGHSAYRGLVGAVMQDDMLMSGSIGENICFFDTDPDQGWIEECARHAAIHDDILAMPMGYMTMIGDMGSSLSGGQKQRILLARALYFKPKLLFLDEATSHLDKENELIVSSAIANLNITRLLIAHRQETIDIADRVIRMSLHAAD